MLVPKAENPRRGPVAGGRVGAVCGHPCSISFLVRSTYRDAVAG